MAGEIETRTVSDVVHQAVSVNGYRATLQTTRTQVEDHTNKRHVVLDDHDDSTGRWEGDLAVVISTQLSGKV